MRILHTFSDADSAHTTDIHTRGACKRCRWFLELLAPVSVSASPRFTLTWEFLKQLHANRSAKRRAQEKENLVPSARICVCIKACVTTYLCFNDKSHFTLHMLHKIWNPPIDSLSYSNQSFPWQLSTVVCPSRQLDLRRWRYILTGLLWYIYLGYADGWDRNGCGTIVFFETVLLSNCFSVPAHGAILHTIFRATWKLHHSWASEVAACRSISRDIAKVELGSTSATVQSTSSRNATL